MEFRKNLTRLVAALVDNPDHHDIEEIQEFILEASADDLRGSYRQVCQLCHLLTELLVQTQRSVSGINLISNTISNIQTSRTQLTLIHSDLCLLCLDAKCINPALRFLDIDYSEIKKSEDRDDDVKQIMLFYYYGGLIYAATKQFEKASLFFEVVLTMPAHVVNPVMQETYKKQIILSLLINGKLPENLLPKYTSPCVTSMRKGVASHYVKFAQDYPSLNYDNIAKTIRNFANVYQRDENAGLIRQCLTQVHRRNIKMLTKTFLTLSLKDVATQVGLKSEQEAEEYILNMIDDGEIFATINQKDGMVVFEDNPESYESADVFQKLQEDMSVSTSLTKLLIQLDNDSDRERSRSGL